MGNLAKFRVTHDRLNSYLGQLLDPKLSTKISYYTEPNNAILYVNLYDFLESQIANNLHRFFYEVDTTTFKKAKKYLTAVCEDTVYKSDTDCQQAFMQACRIFLQDMAALQIVLNNTFTELYVEPTVPKIFREQLRNEVDYTDTEEVLKHSGEILFFDSYTLFAPLLAEDTKAISKAMQQLMLLGPVVYQNIDTRKVLLSAFKGGPVAIDQKLVQLHLLDQNIIAFGGIHD